MGVSLEALPRLASLGALTRDDVEALSRALEEPTFMRDRRLAALVAFEKMDWPGFGEEEWRFSEVDGEAIGGIAAAGQSSDAERSSGADRPTAVAHAVHGKSGSFFGGGPGEDLIVSTDRRTALAQLTPAAANSGVVLMSLARAARELPETVERHLPAQSFADRFEALRAALWSAGVFLLVPEGAEVAAPLGALEVLSVPGASFTQNIVVASRGSRVTFLQGHVSEGLGEAALHLSSTHAVAEEDAALDLVSLQEWTGPVTHFGKLQAVVGSRARVRTTVITMGGEKVRFSPEAVLSGPGGQYAASGLYFADAGQHFEYRTKIEHLAAHTRSDLLYKGALQGKGARSVFVGDVRVAKGAVGTDAFQANRNLILTEGARADSIPFLEIEAADVRCSHAAATGTVDDEHLFYLMARGIPKEQAKRLVVFGFFADVLARVELEGLRERLTASIEEELARGGER